MASEYKFMQIAGNCASIGYLGDERIRGPVDNVITMDAECIKMLIENKYYDAVCTYLPTLADKRPTWDGDSKYFYKYKHVWIVHHDPRTNKYKTELKRRIDRFNDFCVSVKNDDKYFFTLSLNEFDVDKKTHKLRGHNTEDKIQYLRSIGLLDKTVFIETRLTENHTDASWDYWASDFKALIKKYNLIAVELTDLSIWHTEQTHNQFIEKASKAIKEHVKMDKNYAYITYLSTDNYIYYILGLYDSLKKTNPAYPLYCCITESVSDNIMQFLASIGINCIRLDTSALQPIIAQSAKLGMKKNWVNATAKLAIFNLEQFDKCVYLDSDFYICKNIDDLFDKPAMSAVEDCAPEPHPEHRNYKLGMSIFCAGMFVFEPDKDFYKKLLNDLVKLPKTIAWNDQTLLAYENQRWIGSDRQLSANYMVNLSPEVFGWYSRKYNYSDIRIKHYVRHKKIPFATKEVVPDIIWSEYYGYFKYLEQLRLAYNCPYEPKTKIQYENIIKKSENDAIDLVFTYVDCNEQKWLKTYTQFCISNNLPTKVDQNRFRSWDLLRYYFRCIDKYLPFVRNVFMVVSNTEQVPDWVDRTKVHVILHSDIIPKKYLPTFSSPCIELFLKNIPGLSEHFIYANDDIFQLKVHSAADFFDSTGNGLIKLHGYNLEKSPTQFAYSVWREYHLIFDRLNKKIASDQYYERPAHQMTALTKTYCEEVHTLLADKLELACTPFRTKNDINQYASVYCAMAHNMIKGSKFNVAYIESEKYINNLIATIIEHKADTLCINDQDWSHFEEDKKKIQNAFEQILPDKCKYELWSPKIEHKYLIIKHPEKKDDKPQTFTGWGF